MVVIAIDCSGSTGNVSRYWNKVKQIIDSNKEVDKGKKTRYLLWDNVCKEVKYDEVARLCHSMRGGGGTASSCLAKKLPAQTDKLILVTDGQVSKGEITMTESAMANKQVTEVDVYFINTGGEINLSTCLPFTRSAQYQLEVIEANGQAEKFQGSTTSFFTDIKAYENLDYFFANVDKLGQMVGMKTLGGTEKASSQIRDGLLDLKTRLLAAQAAKTNTAGVKTTADKLLETLSAADSSVTDTAAACRLARDFLAPEVMSEAKKIERIIMDMCNLCQTKDLSFSQIKSGRYSRAAETMQVTVADVASTNVKPEELAISNDKFTCPISLDQDAACILVRQGRPVLADEDKAVVDMMIDCPLFLLNNSRLVDKLKARLDSVLGQQSLQFLQALQIRQSRQQSIPELTSSSADVSGNYDGSFVSPTTRQPLVAAVVTGLPKTVIDGDAGDNKQQVAANTTNTAYLSTLSKANNWCLANLFFGDKLVGQPELWLAVVYFVAKQLPYLEEAMPAMEALLCHCCSSKRTTVALTGLPEFPMIKVPVKLAIWYCLNGPCIWPDNDVQNRLRALHSISAYLMQLCDINCLPYDKQLLTDMSTIYSAFAYMMRQSHEPAAFKLLKDQIWAQTQNHILIADSAVASAAVVGSAAAAAESVDNSKYTLIMLDGGVELVDKRGQTRAQLPKPLRSLTLSQLYALLNKVDANKKISDITLPATDLLAANCRLAVPPVTSNYGYADSGRECQTQICPLTMRPWLHDRKTGAEWRVAAEAYWGAPAEKQLSAFRYFIDYIVDYKKFPNRNQLIFYFYKRQCGRGISTLCDHIEETADDVLAAYAKVGFTADSVAADPAAIERFITTTQKSMPLKIRATMELGQ